MVPTVSLAINDIVEALKQWKHPVVRDGNVVKITSHPQKKLMIYQFGLFMRSDSLLQVL